MPDTGGPEDPPVVFLLPDGTEISDDPRWRAQQFKNQMEQQSANLAAQAKFAAEKQVADDARRRAAEIPDSEPEDEEPEQVTDYSLMTVQELKEVAAERDLDISGIKKKSELVDLLNSTEE